MITLSIDGGHDGGGTALGPNGTLALGAWGWRRLDRMDGAVYRLRSTLREEALELPSLYRVGVRLRADLAQLHLATHLVVEGYFVPRPTADDLYDREATARYCGRVARIVELGEAVGELVGPLKGEAARLDRVLASQWRVEVLELSPSCSSDESEARAISWMTRPRPLVVGLRELATDPHVAESAAMAVWGHRQRHPAQQGLFGGIA